MRREQLDPECQERFARLDKPRVELPAPDDDFYRGILVALGPSLLCWALIFVVVYFGFHA